MQIRHLCSRRRFAWAGPALILATMAACGGSEPTAVGPDPDPDSISETPTLAGTWRKGPDIPVGLYHPALYVLDGRIHLIGGAGLTYGSDSQTSQKLFTLDPDGGSWTPGPDYPVEGTRIGLAAIGDTLLGVGGLAFPGKQWARLFQLPPGATVWEQLDFTDGPIGEVSVLPLVGGLLAFEENGSGGMWSYDRDTGAWSKRASQTVPQRGPVLQSVNGSVYVVFGDDPSSSIVSPSFIDGYDAASDQWRRVTLGHASRRDVGVASIGGRIHIVGGIAPDFEVSTTHQVYEPATDTWYVAPPLPEPRAGLFGVAVGGEIWFMGGGHPRLTPSLLREVWIFTPGA